MTLNFDYDKINILQSLNNGPNFCSMHTKCHTRENKRAFNLKTMGEISVLEETIVGSQQLKLNEAPNQRGNERLSYHLHTT